MSAASHIFGPGALFEGAPGAVRAPAGAGAAELAVRSGQELPVGTNGRATKRTKASFFNSLKNYRNWPANCIRNVGRTCGSET